MIDDATLLSRLIDAAEAMMLPRRPAPFPEALIETCAVIQDRARPVPEGGGFIDDHTRLLAIVVSAGMTAKVSYDRRRHAIYAQIAGVLLPYIRDDLSAAIEHRRNARPSTSEGRA